MIESDWQLVERELERYLRIFSRFPFSSSAKESGADETASFRQELEEGIAYARTQASVDLASGDLFSWAERRRASA